MKLFLSLVLLVVALIDIDKIGQINLLKEKAKAAYASGDYAKAIENYRILVDSLKVKEDEVLMNLANAYFNSNDSINAAGSYRSLAQSHDAGLKSLAHQQLGVLANRSGNFEDALTFFKEALKTNPANEDARYNYEMVKKKLEEQKKQDQQNKDQDKDQKDENKENKDKQNQDQKDKDKENKDQKDKEQKDEQEQKDQEQKDKEKKEQEQKDQSKEDEAKDKKDIPPSVSEKLKEMNMSEEKAKMILEAMKNQEIQYLQQNKRKATKPKDKSKPDW